MKLRLWFHAEAIHMLSHLAAGNRAWTRMDAHAHEWTRIDAVPFPA